MSTLKNYICDNGLTITSFAKQSGLSVPTVWRYVNGKFKPNAQNALLIEQVTKGEVTIRESLYPDEG